MKILLVILALISGATETKRTLESREGRELKYSLITNSIYTDSIYYELGESDYIMTDKINTTVIQDASNLIEYRVDSGLWVGWNFGDIIEGEKVTYRYLKRNEHTRQIQTYSHCEIDGETFAKNSPESFYTDSSSLSTIYMTEETCTTKIDTASSSITRTEYAYIGNVEPAVVVANGIVKFRDAQAFYSSSTETYLSWDEEWITKEYIIDNGIPNDSYSEINIDGIAEDDIKIYVWEQLNYYGYDEWYLNDNATVETIIDEGDSDKRLKTTIINPNLSVSIHLIRLNETIVAEPITADEPPIDTTDPVVTEDETIEGSEAEIIVNEDNVIEDKIELDSSSDKFYIYAGIGSAAAMALIILILKMKVI